MLKMKICSTVFVLYEIIAVCLLHMPETCQAMFGATFCMDHTFKYFIACFAVPMLVLMLVMWIMHIINAVRHRHSLMYRAKDAVRGIVRNVGNHISESVSTQDLEKMIVGALLIGVKKYVARHPNARHAFDDMIDGSDMDAFESDAPASAPRKGARPAPRTNSAPKSKAPSKKKK